MGFMPQEAQWGTVAFTHQLLMNVISVIVLFGLGFLLPAIAQHQNKKAALTTEK
jgi:hypothetical protein